VVYNVLNAATDSSPATDPAADAQQKLVRFFVMRVLFAQQASQALRRFPSTPTALAQIADTVDPGKFSTEFAYTVRAGDDWDVALLWNGGRMGLTLRRPDAALVTDQSDSSPLVIPIRNAAPGVWKVFARGLDVPSANTPFVLMIIPRRGTNLLNGIPSPLQISKDVNVLMSNLGLALAMALLFALSAALFADTFAERQGQSNRLLSTVGSAAGKVSGIFSPLFMPTTWKLPPLVRRLAVAIGLAVFLALAALIASFLDSNFAPTSLRGVGIFAGMFVALAVGTLAYALAQSASARSFGAIGAFQIRPGYLIVVAVSVLASRLLGFVPGFLFGLPAGFAVLGTLEGAKRRDGMLAFVALLTPLAVGLAFWLLAIPTDLALQSLTQGQMDATLSTGLIAAIGTVQTVFLFVFFVALWQTLFELFPVAGLKGWTLFMRGRVIWFILLVVTAFLTLHALVNPNATALEMPENRALLLIVVVLAIYSAVAIGTWLLFNAGRLRGEGATPKRATSIVLVLTILIWLCVCVSGAALAALRYLGPK
jgi:hypothetical protein